MCVCKSDYTKNYQLQKMRLIRNVFSSDLKVFNDLHVLMSSGKEFHRVGAIYKNALSP